MSCFRTEVSSFSDYVIYCPKRVQLQCRHMKRLLSSVLVFLLACIAASPQSKPHLYIRVTLARNVGDAAVSGRLLNWRELGPNLNGKIHLYVGTADNYYLDQPARLLRQTIRELGGTAEFVFLPHRTHANVYDGGVAEQIWQEMLHTARPVLLQ
jgi:hypothetical protein